MSLAPLVDPVGVLALGLAAALGVVLAALQLPGTWLILVAAVVYDWCYDWSRLGPVLLGVLLGLALLGELVEFGASMVFAGRAGGSRRASWGGLIGGIVGMFIFTIPVPVLGTVIGGVLGCLAGAVIGELSVRRDLDHSARVGVVTALGHIAGTIAKLLIALVIAGLTLSRAVFQ